MPDQLFPGVGVVTCLMVLKAHHTHPDDHDVWFAQWKDDGHRLLKGNRVERAEGACSPRLSGITPCTGCSSTRIGRTPAPIRRTPPTR
jgi:hypothetical protein